MDRQTKHSPPLGQRRPAFPLRGKWGDFADYRKFVPSMNYCYFFSLKLRLFMKFVKQTKTNLQKKYLHPSSLNRLTYICASAMPRAKKGQQKVPILKKTTVFFAPLEVITLCQVPSDWVRIFDLRSVDRWLRGDS